MWPSRKVRIYPPATRSRYSAVSLGWNSSEVGRYQGGRSIV